MLQPNQVLECLTLLHTEMKDEVSNTAHRAQFGLLVTQYTSCVKLNSASEITETIAQCLHFEYPEVTPCLHELKDVKPVPYRPFRWGEYQ